MNLYNIRFGFATNSSSTHSIVFISPNTSIKDSKITNNEFGWENFVCASKESKQHYLAVLLRDHFNSLHEQEFLELGFFNHLLESKLTNIPEGYIDHQSSISLPKSWDGHGLNISFFKELVTFLLQDSIAILGGNDNDDEEHPLLIKSIQIDLPFFLDQNYDNIVARKDIKGNYWTLFNRTTGTKTRFSFNLITSVPCKSMSPELVDVKITNYCDANCAFCYQDSNLTGKHADPTYLWSLAELFEDHQVFEVALGGGEPTSHPEFVRILRYFRERGIIPNFTTRKLDWLKTPQWSSIIKHCGSFAYSPTSLQSIAKLAKHLEDKSETIKDLKGIDNFKPNIHLVLGTMSRKEFKDYLTTCYRYKFTPIILGYKITGRGSQFVPSSYTWWIDVVKEVFNETGYLWIGIDTVVAQQFGELLEAEKIPTFLLHKEEGKFSCYVDAVSQTLKSSSFSTEKGYDFNYQNLSKFTDYYGTF